MMTFATPRQMIGIILISAAALYGVDRVTHPQPLRSFFGAGFGAGAAASMLEAPHATGPRVSLWMNHMTCGGCAVELRTALAALPFIGKVTAIDEHGKPMADDAPAGKELGGGVELEVTDLARLDFVALDSAVRGAGMFAAKMEFGGVTHFRLQADFKHLCDAACARGLVEGVELLQRHRAIGPFAWIDSASVDLEKKNLVVYARYDRKVDVAQLLAAIAQLGFQPSAVRVLAGDRG